jgi:hypothetical protein
MENHKIRKANSSDVKDILRLLIELAVYEKEPNAVKVTESDLIRDGFGQSPKFECILAEFNSEIVGLAFYTPRYSLYKSFLSEAKKRGVNRVEWSVLDWNKPAIDFYKNTGAIIDGLDQWKIVRMDKEIIEKFLSN